MSKIALIVDESGDHKAQVVAAIRECASISVGEIATAMRTGRACFEVPLFGRKGPDFSQRLLKLLSKLDELGARMRRMRCSIRNNLKSSIDLLTIKSRKTG